MKNSKHEYRHFIYFLPLAILTIVCWTAAIANAQKPTFGPALLENAGSNSTAENRSIIVPYVFRSDQIGFAGGVGGGMTGFQDGQMSIAGTAYVSGKNALAGIGTVNNARLPYTDRLFLDFITMDGTYPDLWIYDNNEGGTRGGSNDSKQSDRYQGRGVDNMFEATFKYVLPWGDGEANPIATYKLDRGMLDPKEKNNVAGGGEWNPFKSGLTYFEVTPFYRHQSVDDIEGGNHHYKTYGLRLGMRYDNTDFPLNPSLGSKQRLQLSQGIPGLADTKSWTALEFQFSKFFSLGESEYARQRVIALDFWTSATLSDEPAPPWDGSTLGGRYRMKGYDDYRFWDKAAIYYSAEYRYIPKWNPLKDLTFVKVDWIQFILFGELGRVAPQWSITELNTDMKYDAGFSVAAFVNKYLGRMDFAFSPETWHIRVGVSQSF